MFGVKNKDADEDFESVIEYLLRAIENDKELIAEITEQDINAIIAYWESYNYRRQASPELDMLFTWELQSLLQEMARINRGERNLSKAPILKKYWSFPPSIDKDYLKLIFFPADDEVVSALLYGVFKKPASFRRAPTAAASIWINYYKRKKPSYG